MAVAKILLNYRFTPLSDPDAVRLWQRDLAELLGLRGRIVISPHGINGTVGGELGAMKRYVRKTREYPAFKDIDFKWSDGTALDESGRSADFPRLSVKVRPELVSFGAPGELRVDEGGIIGGGVRLAPKELHSLVEQKTDAGEEVVFFDGRNRVEASLGKFRGAVVPEVDFTRDFVSEIDAGKFDDLKDKPIVTYCTGGIRCEVLSAILIDRGFTEVYQLDGGIARYREAYGESGLWDGALYVFDNRISLPFTAEAAALGGDHRVVPAKEASVL